MIFLWFCFRVPKVQELGKQLLRYRHCHLVVKDFELRELQVPGWVLRLWRLQKNKHNLELFFYEIPNVTFKIGEHNLLISIKPCKYNRIRYVQFQT